MPLTQYSKAMATAKPADADLHIFQQLPEPKRYMPSHPEDTAGQKLTEDTMIQTGHGFPTVLTNALMFPHPLAEEAEDRHGQNTDPM